MSFNVFLVILIDVIPYLSVYYIRLKANYSKLILEFMNLIKTYCQMTVKFDISFTV